MSAAAGATRECPHCRATILASAAVCPQCRHHLRFDAGSKRSTATAVTVLKVEGSIRQPAQGASEYCVVVAISDARGKEIQRQVIGVGALQPEEERNFTLSVDLSKA
jgi:hypothetical protein